MEIRLREIKVSDAPLMLEWMHDKTVQRGFRKNMLDSTIDQARDFCRNSTIPNEPVDGGSIHYAIANEDDEYLGTVSLKNFDLESRSVEYAITTRPKLQHQGVGFKATGLVLKKAFEDYQLHRVYLSVYSDNDVAIKLYEKCGFLFEGEFRKHIKRDNEYVNWKWYGMLAEEFDERRFLV